MKSKGEKQNIKKKQLITVDVLGDEYELEVGLDMTVERIVNRYIANGYYRQNITFQDIKVTGKKGERIQFTTKIKELKNENQDIYLKLDEEKNASQNESDHEEMFTKVEKQVSKKQPEVFQPSKQNVENSQQLLNKTVKITSVSHSVSSSQQDKNPNFNNSNILQLIKEVQKEKMNLATFKLDPSIEGQIKNLHKELFENRKTLEFIVKKMNELPQFYAYKTKIQLYNLTSYIEYLKEVLEKNSPQINGKEIIFDEVRSESKIYTLFFGDNLAYKYERQLLKYIQIQKNKQIRKIKPLFSYHEGMSPERITLHVQNSIENCSNLLYLFQTESEKIFGGFSFSNINKKKKSEQNILIEIDESFKAYSINNLIKQNPFSCLVFGNHEMEIIETETKLILDYHPSKNSNLPASFSQKMKNAKNERIKLFQIFQLQFREQLTFLVQDD